MNYPSDLIEYLEFIKKSIIKGTRWGQGLNMVLREISNYATVSEDGSSSKVKLLNPNISVEAEKLRQTLDWKSFDKATTNEHQMPLKDLRTRWMSFGKNLTEEIIWEDFCKWPFVTITKEENKKLTRNLKGRTPEQRYADANIVIFNRNHQE